MGPQQFDFVAREALHLLVGGGVFGHRFETGQFVAAGAQTPDGADERIQIGEFLGQLGVCGRIGAEVQFGLDRFPAFEELFQLIFGQSGHGAMMFFLSWPLPDPCTCGAAPTANGGFPPWVAALLSGRLIGSRPVRGQFV